MVGVRTKSATVDNTERRVESLQGLHGILYVYLSQLVAGHHRGRTRKTVFLQFLKPRNHHLIQLVGIVFQINCYKSFLAHGKLARLETDKTNVNHIAYRQACHHELSIGRCNGALGSVFQLHGGTHNGFVRVVVDYYAFNRNVAR